MTLSIGQVQALTTKGIDSMVRDSVLKNNAFLARLEEKKGDYSGERMTFPFNYKSSTDSTGSFYNGAEALSLDLYDNITELAFDIVEIQETCVITSRDLARNSGKNARLKLIAEKLKLMEKYMRERFTKGLFSDGTAATGALTTAQFVGIQAFLKSSGVNYGGVTSTDVSTHVAYVNSNAGVDRALTTALIQDVYGGASEGQVSPTVGISTQAVQSKFLELLKPFQRTTREDTINNLGHKGNTLVYNGMDFIVDNLAPAKTMAFLNEDYVKLYVHPEYNMKQVSKDVLETMDATMNRLFWKGTFACSVLRYQGYLKDIQIS